MLVFTRRRQEAIRIGDRIEVRVLRVGRDGVRIGPVDEDRVTAFIPPFEREDRVYQGTAGEGIAVDADGNVYAAEGPNSLAQAGGAFTKYSVK